MTQTKTHYGDSYHKIVKQGSLPSASKVVPLILSLVKPSSVVDIGCGTGAWLSVFAKNGVQDILGVDGDYVNRTALLIPPERFKGHDLSQPLSIDRRFDLVMSVEVAEHIPTTSSATFVKNLSALGDIVVFSAAIPNQGGRGHINEQWPEFWRSLFEAEGYVLINCFRYRLWDDPDVERWYRQNLLLYVRSTVLQNDATLKREYEECKHQPLSVVHPDTFYPLSFSQAVRTLPVSFVRALKKRVLKI